MIHSFDSEVAEAVGVLPAVLFQSIAYWVAHNAANGTNEHDGKFWTYNTLSAYAQLFPYATLKQVRNALDKLKEEGLIIVSNFNTDKRDRTAWYTVTEAGERLLHNGNCKCLNGQSHMPETAVSYAQNGKCTNTVNTQLNTSVNNTSSAFPDVWAIYPRKDGKKKAQAAYDRAIKRGVSHETIKAGVERYLHYIEADGVDPQYIRMGSTFFTNENWADEWKPRKKVTTETIAKNMDLSGMLDF